MLTGKDESANHGAKEKSLGELETGLTSVRQVIGT